MKEKWKECLDGWYEVSDQGRVRRAKPGCGTRVGWIMSECDNNHGYALICCTIHGKHQIAFPHRLVAEAFLGPCPPGKEVNHKDGVKRNNVAKNLEYLTRQENIFHAYDLGLCKLSVPQEVIDDIRAMRKKGMSFGRIAKAAGVSTAYCWLLCNNKRRTRRHKEPPC